MNHLATMGRDPAPRYLRLAASLRADILAGRFGSETPFPTESDLCAAHGVSRFTVREALRRLQNEGLIARRRGSGTVVQPARARGGALHQPLSNVGEILQYARDTRVTYQPAGHGPLPAWLGASIGIPASGQWALVHGVRTTVDGDQPIATTTAYFHEMLGDAAARLDLAAGTLFSQIEALSGVSVGQVTQDIQAVIAGADIARELGIKRGAAVLRIIRCYRDAKGQVFEISVSHHPGDRFAYSMHIDVE
ncbi:GntR family transcriptional regulator [Sandarakinorhabdus limnophila]|uniref:GntR family transcriptional regulator n=1 Tax=Sandarakinorhabdus limnophila TaxID=210512 RepID=UPI0026EE943F|nr:GntR family transcriptional regulator [Sandarakinorhabdus limnophila]